MNTTGLARDNGILVVTTSEGSVRLSVADVRGYSIEDRSLVLHRIGDVDLRCYGTSEEIRGLASAIMAHICLLGEVTRSMLSMGTRRGSPGVDHNTFFAPLLKNIERARGCVTAEDIVAEFSGAELVAALQAALTELAGAYHPNAAPERRALTEQLFEQLAAADAAAKVLDTEASNFVTSDSREVFAAWHRWHAALERLAMETDSAWRRVLPVLSAIPGGRRTPPAPGHPA